jgi:hypothetical protein
MCNCTSENPEIPGSRFRAPRNDVSIANLHVAAAALNRAALRGGPELKVAATVGCLIGNADGEWNAASQQNMSIRIF